MSWLIKDFMEPAFDSALLDAKVVKGGVFVVKTITQRNNIKLGYRSFSATTTTFCFVSDTNQLYKLISEPGTDTTTNANWELVSLGVNASLKPIGEWDPTVNVPDLDDAGALNRNGEFYFAINAGSGYVFSDPDLFEGQVVTVNNGDWIVSIGNRWALLRPAVTWEMLIKPQSIIDYVNGTVIDHQHDINDVNNLQATLDEKFDSDDVANPAAAFETVPDEALIQLSFLKAWYYTKAQVDTLLGEAGGGSVVFTNDINVLLEDGKSFGRWTSGDIIPAAGKTIQQVIEEAVTDLIAPVFTSFDIVNSKFIEVGAPLSGNKVFTWTLQNTDALQANSLQIRDTTANVLIATSISSLTGFTAPIGTISNVAPINHRWQAEGVDTEGEGFVSEEVEISSGYPVFFGKVSVPGAAGSGRPTITQSHINSATKLVVESLDEVLCSLAAGVNDYCFIAIPADSPLKTKWFISEYNQGDIGGSVGLGFNLFPTPTMLTIDSPTGNWSDVNYNIYLTNYQSAIPLVKFTNS